MILQNLDDQKRREQDNLYKKKYKKTKKEKQSYII